MPRCRYSRRPLLLPCQSENKAAELGRIGGRGKRSAAGENADPIQIFSNDPIGVCDALGKIVTDLLADPGSFEVGGPNTFD